MTPNAGSSDKVSKNRGFMAIPEIGDQVIINFVHQHPDRPFVMGGMFHGGVGGGGGAGNNVKSLSSKSGNIICLNDGAGIEIKDRNGNHVTLSGTGDLTTQISNNSTEEIGSNLSINVGKNKATLTMGDDGKVEIESTKEISFKTGGSSIIMHEDGNISITGKNITIEGMNTTKVIGHTQTDIGKCDGNPGVVVNDNVLINGSIVTIKGSTQVDIN